MRRSLAVLTLSLATTACARKAPGPEECRRFAHRTSGVSPLELARAPQLRERVDELIRQCLTTPYDRELLGCVEQTGRLRACTLDFEQRRDRKLAKPDPEDWFVR
jgi:hypothetical protein